MAHNLKTPRTSAFLHQNGRCYYCSCPMWTDYPHPFAERYGITIAQAGLFRCTGEHLKPRADGGANTGPNIVAACRFCNSRRHKRPVAPEPLQYRKLVQKRVRQGRWFPFALPMPPSNDHQPPIRTAP